MAVSAAGFSFVAPVGDLKAVVDAGALSNRGVAWKKLGRLDLAQRDLERAMDLGPDTRNLYFNHAAVMAEAGRLREAESSFREELKRNPYHASAAGNLAVILMRHGKYDEVISLLNRTLRQVPESRICWTNLIVAHATKGDLPGARNAMERAESEGIVLDPRLKAAVERGG
jgi:tetratricopeptide (TPR) repeat protein